MQIVIGIVSLESIVYQVYSKAPALISGVPGITGGKVVNNKVT